MPWWLLIETEFGARGINAKLIREPVTSAHFDLDTMFSFLLGLVLVGLVGKFPLNCFIKKNFSTLNLYFGSTI